MNIRLSDHFTYGRLIRFTLPSIVMMVFTSIYGVVDGIFVSNFVGKTSFAAVNLIMPFLMLFGALGFMIGTGGSALVAKTLGEGKKERANQLFSMLIYVTILVGAFFGLLGMIIMRPVAALLGAEGEMLEQCVLYGMILSPSLITFMLQNVFQSFCAAAEKPRLGLIVTVGAGLTNIALDALFIAWFRWGVAGAAAATAIAQLAGGGIPLVYFLRPNSSLLRLGKPLWSLRALGQAAFNGASEFLSNVSLSLVSMVFNLQLMKFAGENGVAAYGVIMYVNFIFTSIYIGYSIGSSPVVSYHFGARNHTELRSLLQKSLHLMTLGGVALTATAVLLAPVLGRLFTGYDQELMKLTVRAFRIYALSFLMAGVNIYASAFFTALNDGLTSGTISTLRILVFQLASVTVLPALFGVDGVWLSVVAGDVLALGVSVFFFAKMKTKYGY